MTLPDRAQLVRTAAAIERRLAQQFTRAEPNELPVAAWERCRRLVQLAAQCRAGGWPAAERECRLRLRRAHHELSRQLEAIVDDFQPRATYRPSLGELYADLAALQEEFGGLSIDLHHTLLSVTTEPIELEGINLGRFQIELDWRRLSQGNSAYAVMALDAYPAAANSSVTHPHLNDERLCEGEAFGSIRTALSSGRLLDFFTIVAQTLATYNPESAYVSLDRWGGTSCADCGCVTDEDDRTSCERCECDLCCDCSCGCGECGRYVCCECSASCSACSENHCQPCLATCRGCERNFCERCLVDEQCQPCRDAAAADDDEKPAVERQKNSPGQTSAGPPAAPAAAGAPNHALCLGEAGVSA